MQPAVLASKWAVGGGDQSEQVTFEGEALVLNFWDVSATKLSSSQSTKARFLGTNVASTFSAVVQSRLLDIAE